MYKNCNVVMLPTNENASNIVKILKDTISYTTTENISGGTYQHLYITSDEEIKEGDYTIYCSIWLCKILKHYGDQVLVVKVHDNTQIIVLIPEHKKIIATTDKNLVTKYDERFEDVTINKNSLNQKLPQLPQQFIYDYIAEYNKGNVITEVMVEYNEKGIIQRGRGGERTITIRKIKDSWSREEVVELLFKCQDEVTYPETYYEPCKGDDENRKEFKDDMEEWIEENL